MKTSAVLVISGLAYAGHLHGNLVVADSWCDLLLSFIAGRISQYVRLLDGSVTGKCYNGIISFRSIDSGDR